MSLDALPAPAITAELVTALFSTDDTVIVQDCKTGTVSYKKLTGKQLDEPRWLVIATRETIVAAAAAKLTADLATEWAL